MEVNPRVKLAKRLMASESVRQQTKAGFFERAKFFKFVLTFLKAGSFRRFDAYLNNPTNDSGGKFMIKCTSPESIDNDIEYKMAKKIIGYDENYAFLDAPFGLTLCTKTKSSSWGPLSHISFYPDFRKRTLFLRQVQGVPGGDRYKEGKELNRLRFKFKSPEVVLIDRLIEICKLSEIPSLAILDPKKSSYDKVREHGKLYILAYEYLKSIYGEPKNEDVYFIFKI